MPGIMGQTSDSGERRQVRRLSDSYDRPSTSRGESRNNFIFNIGNTVTHSNINQTIDSEPIIKIKKLDGFPSTPEVFIGRNEEVGKLRELIQKRQKVLINGIGGVGKTRLAIECARQWVKGGDFDRAVFINVETEQEANKRFTSLGKKLNENPEVVDVYENVNEKCSGQTLFILDNVERTNDIKKFLPPKDLENIKILATSQDSEYILLFTVFKLLALAEQKAVDLMVELLKDVQLKLEEQEIDRSQLLTVKDEDKPCIRKLVSALEGHPLALQHACAFCVNNILYESEDDLADCIHKYVEQLQEQITEDFPGDYDAGDYKKTIFASISLNVHKAIVNEHVRDFLFTMCFMNPTFIELKYFRNCGYFSEVQIKESKRNLLKHSIIHFRDDKSEDINVHRLVLFICLRMLRKKNLEAHIVGIIFGMYFGDRRAHIYHGSFLFQNTNLEKKDLAGLYTNEFKKSHFMSELSARLQRVDLTVEDIESWGVLHYCKFAEHDYWFEYFHKIPEINESKILKVGWPRKIVDFLKGKFVDFGDVNFSKTSVKDLTVLHFYAAFGSNLWHFEDLIYEIKDAEIVRSSRLFNIAMRNKNYHFGIELLKRGSKYEDKDMALMCAVLKRDLNLTRTLIAEGAEVNFTDDAGLSPVFLAIVTADDTILNELQQHGANIESALNGKDGIKNTALLSVIKGEFVASHDYPNEEFHFFPQYILKSETQILTAVELLIKVGADLNCVDQKSHTPLMIALRESYKHVAVKLINAGADVNKANDDGDTPLMLAKEAELDYSLIELLEERAAICEGYSQSAPTPTTSDLKQPKWFLNKYWKWRWKTCQDVQTHLEKSQNNLKKLLQSSSGPSFTTSIYDFDKKIEICLIGLKQKDEAINDLDFSFLAEILMYNTNASITNAIHSSEYGVGVLETLAEFTFETKFELPANLIDLYDKYVDIKINNSALRSEKTSENDETEVHLDAVRRVHQELAVRLLLPEEKSLPGLEKLKNFKANYKNFVRVGILTLEEGQLKYLNSNVAEYLLTDYLISNFYSETVQTMFLHKILMEDKFKLTREFFDSQLEQIFENEYLVQNKSDERHKQLNCLKENRFRNLAGVEFTDKVKEAVRLTLQEDKDFLLLKRVEAEGRAHIIKYLVNKFESDMDTLLSLKKQSYKYRQPTYLTIAISERTKTFKSLLYYMVENIDQNIFFCTLKLLSNLSSKSETESFLDFLKDKLSQKNLVLLLSITQTNEYEINVHHDDVCSCTDSETLKVFIEFLKRNLDKENLGNLLQQTTQKKSTALHIISYNADSEIFKVFLDSLEQNLDKEILGNLLQQTSQYISTALHRISEKAHSETLQVFLEVLEQLLDKKNLGKLFQQTSQYKSTAHHRISEKADSETLHVFLDLLKQNLDKMNLGKLFQQTNEDGYTALHLISEKTDNKTVQVFLEFLEQNLDKENLWNLLQQTNQTKSNALHIISEKAGHETLKVFLEFLKQNLDKDSLELRPYITGLLAAYTVLRNGW